MTAYPAARIEEATRQAVGLLFGADRAITGIKHGDDGMIRANFTRPGDATVFTIEAKIAKNRLVWRYLQPTGEFGRWRNGKYDEYLKVGTAGDVKMKG